MEPRDEGQRRIFPSYCFEMRLWHDVLGALRWGGSELFGSCVWSRAGKCKSPGRVTRISHTHRGVIHHTPLVTVASHICQGVIFQCRPRRCGEQD